MDQVPEAVQNQANPMMPARAKIQVKRRGQGPVLGQAQPVAALQAAGEQKEPSLPLFDGLVFDGPVVKRLFL